MPRPLFLLITGLLFAGRLLAQPTSPYRNLVMEGGGIRGISYGGALQVLAAPEYKVNYIYQNLFRAAGC